MAAGGKAKDCRRRRIELGFGGSCIVAKSSRIVPKITGPEPTPDTRPFWDAAQSKILKIQRCNSCHQWFFYPRPFCPLCGSSSVKWVETSGRARLHSYLINQRPGPGFEELGPYVVAVVELHEGPRMMSNIVDVEPDPEQLQLDMELEVVFEERGGVSVPLFRPVSEKS